MKKKLLNFLKIFVICFITSLVVQFIVNGLPLFGLPDISEIESVEITDISANKSLTITPDSDKFEMARNTPGVIRITLGKPTNDSYRYTFTYTLKDGSTVEVSANEQSVSYKGKTYKTKGDTGKLFCKIADGYFFNPYQN